MMRSRSWKPGKTWARIRGRLFVPKGQGKKAQGTVFQVPWVAVAVPSLKGKSKPGREAFALPLQGRPERDPDPGYLKNGTLGYLA